MVNIEPDLQAARSGALAWLSTRKWWLAALFVAFLLGCVA